MIVLERGSEVPRNLARGLADGDYAWPKDGGWVMQRVRGSRIDGGFASTLAAAAKMAGFG